MRMALIPQACAFGCPAVCGRGLNPSLWQLSGFARGCGLPRCLPTLSSKLGARSTVGIQSSGWTCTTPLSMSGALRRSRSRLPPFAPSPHARCVWRPHRISRPRGRGHTPRARGARHLSRRALCGSRRVGSRCLARFCNTISGYPLDTVKAPRLVIRIARLPCWMWHGGGGSMARACLGISESCVARLPVGLSRAPLLACGHAATAATFMPTRSHGLRKAYASSSPASLRCPVGCGMAVVPAWPEHDRRASACEQDLHFLMHPRARCLRCSRFLACSWRARFCSWSCVF